MKFFVSNKSFKHFLLFLITLMLNNNIKSDLPIHCLKEQVNKFILKIQDCRSMDNDGN